MSDRDPKAGGGRRVANRATKALSLLILAAIAALVVWAKPSIGMLIAGAIWLGFLVFWSVTAKDQGSRKTEESRKSRAFHELLLNIGLLLLFTWIPRLDARFLPPIRWNVPVGLGIMVAATLFHIWARVHLGKNWSSPVMIKTGHELVRTGPYRFVRHPIYTAILGLAVGTALVSGRWLSLAGAGVFAFAYVRKLRMEEDALAQTFGAAWGDYRKRSSALVPWVY